MSSPRFDPAAVPTAATPGQAAPDGQAGPSAPPVERELAELRRQGAKAAARGEALESNPMLEPVNRPAATGETARAWYSRREAWERGHSAQGLSTDLTDRPASGPMRISHLADEALFGVTRVLTFLGQQGLTTASGFFFEREGRLFLITSRHVLFDTSSGHLPDRIEITVHTDPRDLTRLATLSMLLYRNGRAEWHQAGDSGGDVDVAALELDGSALPAGCVIRPFGPQHLPVEFDLFDVGDRLAIPGFPLGFFDTVHHLPVVRQASIASLYGVRFQGQGYFLTDARMHRGSSGSPVLARVAASDAGPPCWCVLGVHSSRMDMSTRDLVQDESLGLNCAWYSDVLMTLTGGK